MVSMPALDVVDLNLSSSQVKPKTINLVFVASPLSTQHLGVRVCESARSVGFQEYRG